MTRSLYSRRALVIGAVLGGLFGGVGCETLGRDPDLATMMIYLPGNDTVVVDIKNGTIESGPISMFGDVDFSTEFFASDGTPDNRVTEQRFRLDVTPSNEGIVTFVRVTPFSGTLQRVGGGETQIRFALWNLETLMYEFEMLVDASVF